ncbi:MAG: heterodisulfide reductase-related iron-sulfur binding cluster [Gammaproteobacteria bacterium]
MTVGLFATCLVNIARPSVGLAAAKALDLTGRRWVFPRRQTCCGQVAHNAGFRAKAAASAAHCARVFAECDRVVIPSGSCCGFLRKHAPGLADIAGEEVVRFAGKCAELSEFLTEENFTPPRRASALSVVYHDSCAGLRELGIKDAPRALLRRAGVEVNEMKDCEVCCGFGGAFAEKFGGISAALADEKCDNIGDAEVVAMGDTGCILHLEGRLLRLRRRTKVMHWCEALFD